MKLLSEHEASLLQGRLHKIPLPENTKLYVSEGVPQMFRLVSSDRAMTFDDSWLYIPHDILDSMHQQLLVHSSDSLHACLATHPWETEDGDIYPVMVFGQVRVAIVDRFQTKPEISPDLLMSIREALTVADASHEVSSVDLAAQFVSNFMTAEMTVTDLFQRVLMLLAMNCPRTLAAVYERSDDVFRQRLVMGDIGYFDSLGRELATDRAELLTDALRRGRHFIPTQPVPEAPSFLNEPPQFVFAHDGIQSDHTRYLLVVALPGDIPQESLAALYETARLVAGLDERQLSPGIDFERMNGRLERLMSSRETMDDILSDLYSRLQRHMPLTRLALSPLTGPSRVMVGLGVDNRRLELRDRREYSQQILRYLRDRHSLLVEDVRSLEVSAEMQEEYDADDVSSELSFTVFVEPRRKAVVSFGCPRVGRSHLRAHQRLLFQTAQFLSLCTCLTTSSTRNFTSIGDDPPAQVSPARMERFTTISKLSDGYFHDIVDLLSVVLGQAGIIENSVLATDEMTQTKPVVEGVQKINDAVDSITGYLKNLRRLSTLTEDHFREDMSMAGFLADVQTVLGGYARQIRDTKNIALNLAVDIDPRVDLEVRRSTIYDTILPFLIALMEEAICSGNVGLRMRSKRGLPTFEIVFEQRIIGHTALSDLMERVYPAVSSMVDEHGVGRILFPEITLSHVTLNATTCVVAINHVQSDLGDAEESASVHEPVVIGKKDFDG